MVRRKAVSSATRLCASSTRYVSTRARALKKHTRKVRHGRGGTQGDQSGCRVTRHPTSAR
eukprot:2542874-Prymnesium_polylepis.1